MKAYIAGPLFTKVERNYLREIDKICKEFNIKTYLPDRDGGLYRKGKTKEFFEEDVKGFQDCDFVIAILSDSGLFNNVDSGTAWEIGYAYAKGIPIIGIYDNTEVLDERKISLMISSSVNLVRNKNELREKIKELIKK